MNRRLGRRNPLEVGFLPGHRHGSSQIRGLIDGIEIGIETEVGNATGAEIAKEVAIGTVVVTGGTSGKGVAGSVNPGVDVITGEKTAGLKTVVTGNGVTGGQISDQSDHEGARRCRRTRHQNLGSEHQSRPSGRSWLGQNLALPFPRNMPNPTLCIIENQATSLLLARGHTGRSSKRSMSTRSGKWH